MTQRHGDPGVPPSELDDAGLAAMLDLQDPALVAQAITVANFAAFERQTANALYHERYARRYRLDPEVAERKARQFRQHVWWFIQHSPKTRARAREKEQARNGRSISARKRRSGSGSREVPVGRGRTSSAGKGPSRP